MFEGKQYVYEVYKTRSFSRAAENLYISQPSLSAIIKRIEKKTGAPIFDRSSTPLRLTECGEQYIRCIERLMDMENEFGNYLNDLEGLHTGHLSIGGSSLFASYILPPLISDFTKKYPNVGIDLVESTTKQLEKLLLSGNLDLIIDNYAFPKTVYERHLFRDEHLLLAVPAVLLNKYKAAVQRLSASDIRADRHLSDQTKAIDIRLFQKENFLLLRPGNDTRERSDLLLKKAGIQHPSAILQLDQQVTAYHVACCGLGIAFVTDTLIQHMENDPRIAFFRLNGPEARRSIYFYYKQSRYMTKAMEAFLALT